MSGASSAKAVGTTKPSAHPQPERARSDPAVRLRGINITYGGHADAAYTAVAEADLDVGDGEFVAIVGPTGCGKSTLLNVAAGLLKASAGTCDIYGGDLSGINRKAGYLFQSDALMPWKTAAQNISIALQVNGASAAEAREKTTDWLAKVGLRAFADRYPHQLSGGQRKRVALAQTLSLDPRILLMDEPFGPLDAQTRALMGELLLELWSSDRKAVMFVTHDLEEAISLSDRVVVMSAGPGSRIVGDYPVPLERPRDPAEIRHTAEFGAIYRDIWHTLKGEVIKAYEEEDRR